jgi:hypothetical protein
VIEVDPEWEKPPYPPVVLLVCEKLPPYRPDPETERPAPHAWA